ncbi:cation transporter [Sphingosinicella rhizophila]|uniref:Cation transporter n=1 Tax=Sphingosinicella rhizophila TaxID=3050082 RepID=A0ABU3Q7P2_9SPHN|nr:cation transporter [Sphingosinicella sp. GR2756]MDT9599424.1 cation transporter [Sphingosinicella sp. GR2756]
MRPSIPPEIEKDLDRAVGLEYWNIGWTISIVVVMGLAMGNSQTMKTAWVEDLLGLIPPIVFLTAVHFERKPSTRLFPFGFARVHSLAFLVAAVALAAVGLSLLWDAAFTLYAQEHATVASITIFGRDIWLGWVMLAAQVYSIIPPYIIGRKELPLAKRLQDEVLYTDALMNKANWLTGAAGLFGVIGLGLGWWWADSVAAAFISIGIIHDGWKALRIASAELADGVPRALGGLEMDAEAEMLMEKLSCQYPGGAIRLRETGRYIHAEICGIEPDRAQDLNALWPGAPERSWRLAQLSFRPPDEEG